MTFSLSLFVTKKFFFRLELQCCSRKFKGCFKEVLSMFHASIKDRKFQGLFKKVSGVFKEILKGVLREFNDVSRAF